MRIRELQVDGYGALQRISCALDASVTVLYGPNEAGKSTLLRFIRSMLYGFPTRKEPVERGEPVGGGRHGGRLLLLDSSGRELTLERFSDGSAGNGGRKNGVSGFAVRDGTGNALPISQSEWERAYLGGVSERLYRQLFSVSLDELHELRTLQGEEVGNYLYHAGVMGGRALTEARRSLAAEMDKLFKPKGTTPEMNKLLALMKETETSIRQRSNDVRCYNETADALMETESRLALLDRSLPELKAQASDAGRALELREWWLKRLAAEEEEAECAAQLSDPLADPLQEDAAVAWAVLAKEREAAAERLEQARSVLDDLARARARLVWDEGMADAVAELERLDSLRETTVSRREEHASLLAETRAANEQIADWLARISPHWTEKELQAFAGTTAEREQARRMQQAWGESERALERLDAEAGRLERQKEAWLIQQRDDSLRSKEAARVSEGEGANRRPGVIFKPADRASLLREWLGVEDQLRQLERARSAALAQQASTMHAGRSALRGRGDKRSARNGLLLALSGVTAAAAFIVLAVNGRTPVSYPIAGVLLAAVATASATALLRRKEARSGRLDSRKGAASDQAEPDQAVQLQTQLVTDSIRRLVANADTGAALFSAGGKAYDGSALALDDEGWSVFRESAYARMEELEREERASDKERERVRRLGEFDREAEAIHRELGRMDAERDRLHMQWREWLEERKLPAELVPEGMPELFGLAEQAQTLLRRRDRLQDRAERLREEIAGFERAAESLLRRFSVPASLSSDTALAVAWAYREARKHVAVREEAERADVRIRDSEEAVEASEYLLGLKEAAAAKAVRDAGESSLDNYERRLRVDERRRALRRLRGEISLRMQAGRSEEETAALLRLLADHDEAALTELDVESRRRLADSDAERTELLDRRGRLKQQLERLRSEAEQRSDAQLLREQESRLERLTEQYAVLALSETLLRRTKAVFEQEKQPEVLRTASAYFGQMTGGAYRKIIAPGDSHTLLAETSDRRTVDSLFLSRGTQEQLYLAMRLALADAASKDCPLPLLLDDLFVHFDEARLRNTIPVIGDIAKGRQLILFTCHRHIAESFERDLVDSNVVRLNVGTARSTFATSVQL